MRRNSLMQAVSEARRVALRARVQPFLKECAQQRSGHAKPRRPMENTAEASAEPSSMVTGRAPQHSPVPTTHCDPIHAAVFLQHPQCGPRKSTDGLIRSDHRQKGKGRDHSLRTPPLRPRMTPMRGRTRTPASRPQGLDSIACMYQQESPFRALYLQ
jgi:hypothetical protein